MAKKSNYSFQKWEREKNRMKKRKEKQDKKQETKDLRSSLKKEGIDPDIADIEPGPQPPADPEE